MLDDKDDFEHRHDRYLRLILEERKRREAKEILDDKDEFETPEARAQIVALTLSTEDIFLFLRCTSIHPTGRKALVEELERRGFYA